MHRTMFECVDEDQGSLPGSYGNTDGMTCTMLKHLAPLVFPAHLTTITKNSIIVSCAPNNSRYCIILFVLNLINS